MRPAAAQRQDAVGRRHAHDAPGDIAALGKERPARVVARDVILRITIVAVINGTLLLMSDGNDPIRLLMASAMLWASWAAWHLHGRQGAHSQMPFVPVVSLVYFMYYGLPVFTGTVHTFDEAQDQPVVTWATGLALAGQLILLIVTYLNIGTKLLPRPQIEIDFSRARWPLVGASVLLLPLSVLVNHVREVLPAAAVAPLNALSRVSLLCLVVFYLVHMRHGSELLQRVLALLVALTFVLIGFATGSLAPVVHAGMPFVFIYMRERRRVPWAFLVAGAIIIFPFLTTKHEYRARAWKRTDLDVVQKVELFFSVTSDAITVGGADFWSQAGRVSQSRTSMLGTFAYVIENTPERVPYWQGETYRNVAWTFIPRFMVPDKPIKSLGQDFGHRYKLLDKWNLDTSYNLPQLVEMYANFGPWGVVFGMVLVAALYRLLHTLLSHGNEGTVLTAVAAVLFSEQLTIESDAGLIIGGVPQTIVVGIVSLIVIGWLAGIRAKSTWNLARLGTAK